MNVLNMFNGYWLQTAELNRIEIVFWQTLRYQQILHRCPENRCSIVSWWNLWFIPLVRTVSNTWYSWNLSPCYIERCFSDKFSTDVTTSIVVIFLCEISHTLDYFVLSAITPSCKLAAAELHEFDLLFCNSQLSEKHAGTNKSNW